MAWDLDFLVRGIANGSVYALVAMTFNILYRPTNVFNFAQGDLVMFGAMIGASLLALSLPWAVAFAVTVVAVGLIGLLEERTAVGPILRRSSSGTSWVISTLAFSLVAANLVGHIWGPDPKKVSPPWFLSVDAQPVLGMRISSYQVFLAVLTVLLVVAVEWFYRTRSGKAVMAIAEDRDAALLRGIDPNRLSRWSFFAGAALAGAVGLLAAPLFYASIGIGTALLLKGFEAAAVGGIGSNKGALLAGYILGIVEALGAQLLSPGLQDATTFALLLAILLIRPQGFFGKWEARHV